MAKKTSIFSNKKLIMFFLFMIIILPLFEPYLKIHEGNNKGLYINGTYVSPLSILGVVIIIFGILFYLFLRIREWLQNRKIGKSSGWNPPPDALAGSAKQKAEYQKLLDQDRLKKQKQGAGKSRRRKK